jgi:hypothetical protein
MKDSNLILVHGLFLSKAGAVPDGLSGACASRSEAFAMYGEGLGVRHYECIVGNQKVLANRLLQLARGTARAVDAVEIIELAEEAVQVSLAEESARACWQKIAACTPYGFDPGRSFILIGKLRQLLSGPVNGQRVLWFGSGLSRLSEAEFIAHYTGHHGPLVASNAQSLGVRRYRQVASEQSALCDSLRKLGLGRATPPPVFADLVMGTPPLNFASLRARRLATQAIKADEKRHIDFSRSMLLLL